MPGDRFFLSYNRRDRHAVAEIRSRLEQDGISTFYDQDDLTPGQPWIQELENALAAACGVAVFVGPDGLGEIQKREYWFAVERQAQEGIRGVRFPLVPVLLPGTNPQAVPAFLALNTWVDLRFEWERGVSGLAQALRGDLLALQDIRRPDICPYRGLEVFREEDSPLFFGRESCTDQLFRKVNTHTLVAVVGGSGTGKSSVVQAGLLPRLRRERSPEPSWEFAIIEPGRRPFHSIAARLVSLWSQPGRPQTELRGEVEDLGERLRQAQIPLAAAVKDAIGHLNTRTGAHRLLLFLDRFEDLFTLTAERERALFVRSLLEAIDDNDRLSLVLTLRADFYGRLLEARDFSDRLADAVVNLGPLTVDELRRAIVEPARSANLRFDDGLVERLLQDTRGQPGHLPLLQFALAELWTRRSNAQLTHTAYDAVGGVRGAVAARADAALASVPNSDREATLTAFTRLVRASEAGQEGADSRQSISWDEFDTRDQLLLERFAQARLIVIGRDWHTGVTTVELAHEALIHHWKALSSAVNLERDFLLWRQRLGFLASEWERSRRAAEFLLPAGLVPAAQRWRRQKLHGLSAREVDFIDASLRSSLGARCRRAVAFGALVCVSLITSLWLLWTRSDSYQIRTVITSANAIVQRENGYMGLSDAPSDWFEVLSYQDRSAALQAALSLSPPYSRALALLSVMRSLAAEDRLMQAQVMSVPGSLERIRELEQATEEALKVARSLPHGEASGVMKAIVRMLASMGQIERALREARSAPDLEARVFSLGEVLAALATAGQMRNAQELVSEMLQMARSLQSAEAKARMLANMARELSESGFSQEGKNAAREALRAARSRPLREEDRNHQVWLLSHVSKALAENGHLDLANMAAQEALEVVRSIPEPYYLQLREVVEAYVSVWLAQHAKPSWTQSLMEVGRLIPSFGMRPTDSTLKEIAEALGRVGQTREALSILSSISDLRVRERTRRRLAESLEFGGYVEDALDLVRAIPDPDQWLLTAIAKALADKGQHREALRVAQSISSEYFRAVALSRIAPAVGKAGVGEELGKAASEVLQTAQKIQDESEKASVFCELAYALALSGHIAQASQSAKEALAIIPKLARIRSSRDLVVLSAAFAALHRYRDARLAAEQSAEPRDQLAAYVAIVRQYAARHRPELAMLLKPKDPQ